MLLIKTKLSLSKIHGVGLFAAEFIPKGTVIWRFHPNLDNVYSKKDLESMDKVHREFLETYCFKYFGKYYLCNDDARFINHSKTPTCSEVGVNDVTDVDLGYTMAGQDIAIGEELTSDYSNFGGESDDKDFNLEALTDDLA